MKDVSLYLDRVMNLKGILAVAIVDKESRALYGAAGTIPIQEGVEFILDIYEAAVRAGTAMGAESDFEDCVYVMETTIHMVREIRTKGAFLWLILSKDANIAIVQREMRLVAEEI